MQTPTRRSLRSLGAGAVMMAMVMFTGACSEEPSEEPVPSELEITVEPYEVSIAVPPGFEFEPGSELIRDGNGAPIREGDDVLLRMYSIELETGVVLHDTFSELPAVWNMTPEIVGADVYNALIHQNIGTSVAIQTETDEGPVVTIVEARGVRAVGNPIAQNIPVGEVDVDEAGRPQFTIDPDGEFPSELSVITTIFGTEEQIIVGDELLVQYELIEWPSGEVVESTWEPDMGPILVGAGDDNMLGRAMIEIPRRSQVVLLVPAQSGQVDASALGGDHIFVVDIIWVQPRQTTPEEEFGGGLDAPSDDNMDSEGDSESDTENEGD